MRLIIIGITLALAFSPQKGRPSKCKGGYLLASAGGYLLTNTGDKLTAC